MEIQTLKLGEFRNEEHYKFHSDFSKLIATNPVAVQGLGDKLSTYVACIEQENAVLNVLRASDITGDLSEMDRMRDATFSGMSGTINSAHNHYDANVCKAADRLRLLLDTYGNVPHKPYDQETSSIVKLVAELEGTYAADVAVVGIGGWVSELKTRNTAFDNLKNERYSENGAKPQDNLKQSRIVTDNIYRTVLKRLNALIEVNGETAYMALVTEQNQRVENYRNLLAQRRGRNAKKDGEDETDTDSPQNS